MLRVREKILQELNRRSSEISWFKDQDIVSQDDIQSFFSGIADYINYIKLQPTLNKFVEELKEDNLFKAVDEQLINDGNQIIDKVKADFKKIKSFIRRKKIKILKWNEIFPGSGVHTLDTNQSISLAYRQVEDFLNKENQFIGDIPNLISNLWSLLGRFEISDSYHEVYRSYEEKLKDKNILVHYLRLEDYQKLNEVWLYYYDKSVKLSHFGFMFYELLDEKRTVYSLSVEQLKLIKDNKTKYLLWLHRFHNYLIDRLEETYWLEEASIWVWENFGRTVVSLFLIIVILWILKFLGVSAPIEFIVNLLKP
jgi:hypothetical protein